jgi:3-dehydroquinate synthase
MTDFQMRHGEAVAIGLAIDTLYSSMALGLPREDADRVFRCLLDLGFALHHPVLRNTESLFNGLEEFRQHLGGRLTLTMLRGVGDPIDVHEIDPDRMRAAIEQLPGLGSTPQAPRRGLATAR